MDEGFKVISRKTISQWAGKPILADFTEPKWMPKGFDEGLLRRSLLKDLDEGLLRRSSTNDLGEGGIFEGLKLVDSIININLHCNFSYMHFWTKTIQREILRDCFLISYSSFSSFSS